MSLAVAVRAFLSSTLAFVAVARAAQPSQSRNESAGDRPFTITFWCGPPLDELDDRRAAEIAAAGFDVIGPPCEGGYDHDRNLRALDVAARHGLRVWVADHRFGRAALGKPGAGAVAAEAVADYRGHPAVAGYFVADEPTADEFTAVGSLVAAVRAADPDRLAYVNLLPDFVKAPNLKAPTYAEYLERFVSAVRPQLLSYDYYPFGKEKDRSSFFANLAAVADAARRHDVPFMLVALAMPHGPYRDPTEAELAWQVYHALAYGARGVSYFTYWTPPHGREPENRNGLIDGGRRTLHYYQVARLNRDLAAFAAELGRLRWRGVADSLGEVAAPLPLGPLDAVDGGSITVGVFDGEGETEALLVNRDYRYGARIGLVTPAETAPPEVFAPDSRSWAAGDWRLALEPGGARLVRWRAARPRNGDGRGTPP
jgi:hypothetical protein